MQAPRGSARVREVRIPAIARPYGSKSDGAVMRPDDDHACARASPPSVSGRRSQMKLALGRVCAVAMIIAAACGGQEALEEVQKAEAAGTELSSSCAGVRPGSASSWTRVIDVDSDSICGVDTSDASGNVIFGWQNDFEVERDFWDVFTTVGHQRGAVSRFGNGRIFPQEWG